MRDPDLILDCEETVKNKLSGCDQWFGSLLPSILTASPYQRSCGLSAKSKIISTFNSFLIVSFLLVAAFLRRSTLISEA